MRGSSAFGGRRAGGDPFGEDRVLGRIDVEPLAALVRHGAGRLEQQQAAAGIARHDPPAQRAARDGESVALVIVAAQRELEAALAGRRAVAGAGIAAGLREDRLDVVAEAPGERCSAKSDGRPQR